MADLSCLIDTTTISKVDKHIEAEAAKEPPRPYMGMSEIGDPCPRRLWLKYHTNFVEPFSGRLYRLFETGHIIEKRIVRDLRGAGYKVNRGKKSNRFSDFDGRFQGHSDGIVSGIEESVKKHILEVKSASDKRFKDFMTKGMESEPKYKAQCHLYMGYAGLKRCLFVIENKNTSERRQERIRFDKGLFETDRKSTR